MVATAEKLPLRDESESRPTILCVDDEKSILSSLRRLFRKEPFEVVVANSGAEGLEILSSRKIDLIISDMRMPQMDGAEFLSQVSQKWPKSIRILLTGYSDMEATVAAVNRGKIYRYLSKPWDQNDLLMTVKRGLEQSSLEQERNRLVKLTVTQNKELKTLNSTLEEKVEARTEQLNTAYRETVSVFSQIVEMREASNCGHGKRVSDLSVEIARQLELPEKLRQDVRTAATLHDLGKVGLPDEIVSRARCQLNKSQHAQYKKHPVIAPGLLMSLPLLENAASMIRSHHEHFDGKGFPDKLQGEAIPLGARIIAVANDYDNFLSGSKTGEVVDSEEVLAIMQKGRGLDYDPKVLDALFDAVEKGYGFESGKAILRVSAKELKVGMRLAKDLLTHDGILLLANDNELTQPLIDKLKAFETDYSALLEIAVCAQ